MHEIDRVMKMLAAKYPHIFMIVIQWQWMEFGMKLSFIEFYYGNLKTKSEAMN
jgi:hypothetical protein